MLIPAMGIYSYICDKNGGFTLHPLEVNYLNFEVDQGYTTKFEMTTRKRKYYTSNLQGST